jgi:hypothetical protein
MSFLGHVLRELGLFPVFFIQACPVPREVVIPFVIPRVQPMRHIDVHLNLIVCAQRNPELALVVESQKAWN